MNIAGYVLRHRTVTMVVMIFIAVAGMLSYQKLGRLEDPEFTIKEAVIFTYYPGATAEEVEQEVSEPLETEIQQLKQLKEVRSISRAGVSVIFAEVEETYDKDTLPQVWDELRRKVAAVAPKLPPGCYAPVVNDDFGDVYGILYAVTGDGYSLRELGEVAEDLRRELLQCEDVGRIDFWGMPDEAIFLEMDRAQLVHLGIPMSAIFNAVRQQNAVTDAGRMVIGGYDVPFRVSGDYTSIEDVGEQLVEGGREGKMLRVKDVAEIRRDYVMPSSALLQRNGEQAIGMGISTVSGGDVIAMGHSIQERLEAIQAQIPVGITLHAIAHQADTVSEAVQGFVWNLFGAAIIVVLLLMIFMGWREGVIIGLVLLLTILGTMIILQLMGITLQRISLGALIIALGMLVDNAIVIAEGIVIKKRMGKTPLEASEETVRENQWPLLGATVIAILAFAAISLSKDMTGEWLKSLFQSICISLGLSWFFAISMTPFLCVTLLPDRPVTGESSHDHLLFHSYRRVLCVFIQYRFLTLLGIVLVLLLAMFGFGHVKQDFMPAMNRPQFTIDLWEPAGTDIETTAHDMKELQGYIRSLDGVTEVTGFAGMGALRFLLTYSPEMPDSAYGQLLVDVHDFKRIPDLIRTIRAHVETHYPNITSSLDMFKLGPGGGAVVARISGPDIPVLRTLADQVVMVMRSNDNACTIRTDWGAALHVAEVRMVDAHAQEIGVTRSDIARSLAMNYSGVTAGLYREEDELLPIVIRAPEKERQRIDDMNNVQIWSETKQCFVPMSQVADRLDARWENAAIHRLDRIRTISIMCKPVEGTTDALFRQLRGSIETLELPERYKLEWGGEFEAATEANTKLMSNMPIAFVCMFLISVMLFNNLRQPLIIFLGLPLALVGVAAGLLIANKPFGFMAMLGFLSLSGMLMKNKIVLLEQINLERALGKNALDAVLDASLSRVRPVCMAAFTTVLGMLPLLWDAFFAPMAVTIMGGLTFATILTLVVTPVMYCTFYNVRRTV